MAQTPCFIKSDSWHFPQSMFSWECWKEHIFSFQRLSLTMWIWLLLRSNGLHGPVASSKKNPYQNSRHKKMQSSIPRSENRRREMGGAHSVFFIIKFRQTEEPGGLQCRDWKAGWTWLSTYLQLHHVSSKPIFWISLKTVQWHMPEVFQKILHYSYSTLFHQAGRLYQLNVCIPRGLLPCTHSPALQAHLTSCSFRDGAKV